MLVVLALMLAQPEPPTAASDPIAAQKDVADVDAPPSKKQKWMTEKTERAAQARPSHRRPAPARAALPVVSLHKLWTHEVLPVPTGQVPGPPEVDRFLRCHYTNQAAHMDGRLLPVVLRAARRFRAPRVEIVSAFRS